MIRRPKMIPSKILYLWEKFGIKKIELFTQEDVEAKQEIPADLDKQPEIPQSGGWIRKLHEKHIKRENKHNGKGR